MIGWRESGKERNKSTHTDTRTIHSTYVCEGEMKYDGGEHIKWVSETTRGDFCYENGLYKMGNICPAAGPFPI